MGVVCLGVRGVGMTYSDLAFKVPFAAFDKMARRGPISLLVSTAPTPFPGKNAAVCPRDAGAGNCLMLCSVLSCHLQSWLDPVMTLCMSLSLSLP